ncbi:UDP-N-acetyl-D-galactosamine dehydrogenase [Chryseobacterium sp. Leaf180]|uniref:nucleotide sugar dehydrogenase n=1 Tax=Chryseobacterium sp. Leaf180 TaxID=1736289 RepID=UPI0006FB2AD6|nr:nucleotide sugar dehydrogenase [Chryseobacterium sp. Leaf180]KQR91855.1 UDP-N-acetyl-D-galactosamine dehydrogenase [Chryseobacterium sp. Leaf180]
MQRKHKIAVIGLGYVGLPLARLLATKYPVVGFDISQSRIQEINAGHDATNEIADEALQAVLLQHNPFKAAEPVNAQCHPEPVEGQRHVEPVVNKTEAGHAEPVEAQCHAELVEAQTYPGLFASSDLNDITHADTFIVTVPTPIDKHNRPDLTPLYRASETVGKVLNKGDIVIYESTVYPGVTEEECVPVLEKISGLKCNTDFFVGYSPERINPGDKEHTVDKILKVTSGSTPEIGQVVDALYKSVITAGTHLAPTIKVAEASKVIENSQRDLNIAFMNELAKIFSLMDIDTQDVLAAAGTKWNFLPFKPGLVGGHCIGVDPFYLAQKAQEIGYYSELILAARRLNDSMGAFVASQVVKLMIQKDLKIKGSKILNLGITFKENCPDIRNSKAIDVITHLQDYGAEVTTVDPWADPAEVFSEYGIHCHAEPVEASDPASSYPEPVEGHCHSELVEGKCHPEPVEGFDAIILTVAHQEFLHLDLSLFLKENGIVYDVKGVLPVSIVNQRL